MRKATILCMVIGLLMLAVPVQAAEFYAASDANRWLTPYGDYHFAQDDISLAVACEWFDLYPGKGVVQVNYPQIGPVYSRPIGAFRPDAVLSRNEYAAIVSRAFDVTVKPSWWIRLFRFGNRAIQPDEALSMLDKAAELASGKAPDSGVIWSKEKTTVTRADAAVLIAERMKTMPKGDLTSAEARRMLLDVSRQSAELQEGLYEAAANGRMKQYQKDFARQQKCLSNLVTPYNQECNADPNWKSADWIWNKPAVDGYGVDATALYGPMCDWATDMNQYQYGLMANLMTGVSNLYPNGAVRIKEIHQTAPKGWVISHGTVAEYVVNVSETTTLKTASGYSAISHPSNRCHLLLIKRGGKWKIAAWWQDRFCDSSVSNWNAQAGSIPTWGAWIQSLGMK